MIRRTVQYLNHRKNKKLVLKEFQALKASEKQTQPRFSLSENDLLPAVSDKTATTQFDRHYVYHPAWAIRKVKEIDPEVHVDISSTLHFCSMLSAFYKVKFYDYRPAAIELSSLESGAQDLTALSFESNSIKSLSCMHTVEHIGLGRYGDAISYDADLIAMKELARVVAPGGNLLFVVPVGHKARIQFNAHRIYTKRMITEQFLEYGLSLKEFTLIGEKTQDGGLLKEPPEALLEKQNYGCGCFWFQKR